MATLNELKELFADRQPHEIAIKVSGISGFRTTLIDELTQEEINKLYEIHAPKPKSIETKEDRNYWISNILTIATEEGLHYPVMVKKNGKLVKDNWHKFNTWMLTLSTVKKLLYFCNVEEMKAVHRQLCKLRDNNEKSAQKPMNRAWFRKGERNKNLN
ncbi:hypothetical protein [Bergeyella zoohelcum]|uniref:Uncharacterized protein n=1 Tax=Bergeyella zoohelcum TaxID=1015 RepID=A0A380ZUW4_9FLAO|nr:hypothetical protein [Bergeyella zoohelcum]EKB58388.1 hypothetical protein HMPREF9700_01840 [Bergeyella zoohelcum CCUG 30536]SUV53151.1 Uncharacterised protein [Bergeyella zoohelcum]